jgi:hypothetical protein
MAEPELHPRRHVFRGHSAGVAANIRRPEIVPLPVQGCSALPVTGGSHESNVEAKQHNKYVSHGPITTSAYGDYVNASDGVDTTLGKVAFDAVPTETRVTASVQDLDVLGKVHVGLAAMGLISRSADGTGQATIRPDGCRLDDVRIGDSRLKITLAEDFYREYDTLDKLAKQHGVGLEPHHAAMFLPADSKATKVTGFPIANGTVKCTLVQKIEWNGPKHPTAEIHGHVVVVPDFGKIYFGEMFIAAHSRRLTMVRFQLGSPDGGEIVAADGENDPGMWPPGS